MTILTMTRTERESFLADVHIGVLSVERADGPPLVTPVWYRYSPGGVVEVSTERSTEKAQLLERSGRASLCVQREAVPYAYVTVDGPVELGRADREARLDIASRYLGPEGGAEYIEHGPSDDTLSITLQPENWHTSDFSKLYASG